MLPESPSVDDRACNNARLFCTILLNPVTLHFAFVCGFSLADVWGKSYRAIATKSVVFSTNLQFVLAASRPMEIVRRCHAIIQDLL
jgi:hypothetical protein